MSLGPAQLLRGLAVLVFLVGWAVLAHLSSAGDSNSGSRDYRSSKGTEFKLRHADAEGDVDGDTG